MRKLIVAAASSGILLLAACTNDATDFKEDAEAYIESDSIESPLSTTFSGTVCVEPATIEAGETFTCTAVAADGTTWDFTVTITGENSYNVTSNGPRP